MNKIEGQQSGIDQKHAIVISDWNAFITGSLLEGALAAFRKHGVEDDDLTVVHVPGAFEAAPVAKKLAQSGRYDAVTCLGAVIRGSTPHFDYVAGQAARLVAQAAYDTGRPVIFGVLTTDTIEQAIERAGTKAGNKGFEAAVSAMEMVSLYHQIEEP